ncbi:zinc ribbon domain-containing protein [Terrisporobacter sp.]
MNMEEGTSSNKYSNYSKKDGSLNKKSNFNYFTLERNKKIHCPKCENLVSDNDIYCKNCGEILENIRSKRERFINQEGEKTKFKDIIRSFDLSNCLKVSISSLGILFALSLIMKILFIGIDNQISQILNPLYIMLFSNFASLNIFMSLFMNSAQSSVNFGFLIIMLLPIASFIIPYKLFMKKTNTSFMTHVKNSLGVAIIYALILVLLAKVSQAQLSLSNDFRQYGYRIYLGFSTWSVLIKGFAIGFISILFMGIKKEYEKESMIATTLKFAFKTIAIGYILVLILILLLNLININYISDLGLSSYTGDLSLGIILSQLAAYLWAFANFIPIDFGIGTISILSLFKSSISLDLMLVLGSLIALSALILIVVGCKLNNKYKTNDIKPVIMFSVFYAAIMGVIGLLTVIYVGENVVSMLSSISSIQMGFNFIIGMVISFVYSLIMTLIGYKLNTFN